MNEKRGKKLLESCLSKAQTLKQLIEYSKDSVVSKTIVDKEAGTITLFSFDKGQTLSEHSAPFDAVVEVIDGKALITIGGIENQVSSGQIIIMPANMPHSVKAQEQFKMLLIMIRS
jgi:quercetin dioxygenase-like cupin family protein